MNALTAPGSEVVTTLERLDQTVQRRADEVAAAEAAQSEAAADLEAATSARTSARARMAALDGRPDAISSATDAVKPPTADVR